MRTPFPDQKSWKDGPNGYDYDRLKSSKRRYDLFATGTAAHYSPWQGRLTPLIRRMKEENRLDTDLLPVLETPCRSLTDIVLLLRRHDVLHLLCSPDVGIPLMTSGVLEFLSCAFNLFSPFLLRQMLVGERSTVFVISFILVSFLAILTGRSKDQIVRMLAMRTSAKLQSSIFKKSMCFSCSARATNPLGSILSVSTHDMEFIRNYLIKVHDIWSGPLQLTVLFISAIRIIGIHGLVGFAVLLLLLFSQSKANFVVQTSGDEYMKVDEQRLTALNQCFRQVRGIKTLALEPLIRMSIDAIRLKQVRSLQEYLQLTFRFFTTVNQMTPGLVALACFLSYRLAGNVLTSDVVFPILTIFDMSYSPASKISWSVNRQYSTVPIFRRIVRLLTAEEERVISQQNMSEAVKLVNATFRYPIPDKKSSDFALGPLNLKVPKGSLVIILGPSGSGKSTLLQALIGQCIADGSTQSSICGSTALSAQNPWILSGTVRDNILFRREFDDSRYREVLRMCCLEEDLSLWPNGDLTKIGERGATLSGGQRARVSLARAVYSKADILLLDDPLSAVDNNVADRIFHGCIEKLPQTVLLVTHQLSLLQFADIVMVLEQGLVKELGPPMTLLSNPTSVSHTITISAPTSDHTPQTKSAKTESDIEAVNATSGDCSSEDKRSQGAVKAGVYWYYFMCAGGNRFLLRTAIFLILTVLTKAMNSTWFILWINDRLGFSQERYMAGFFVSVLTQAISIASLASVLVNGSIRASSVIHERLLKCLFAADITFFDTQPLGRIMNRLSQDISVLDERIMNAMDGLFVAAGALLATVTVLVFTSPYLLVAMGLVIAMCYHVFTMYRVSAREIRRLCSVLDSPPIDLITETLRAISSVKAYQAEPLFIARHQTAIDRSTSALLLQYSLETWMTTRAELLSALLTFSAGVLVASGTISKESAGLALGTTITLAKHVHLALWALINVEVEMNSVGRLYNYIEQIPKDNEHEHTTLADDEWPEQGTIQLVNLTLKYPGADTAALRHVDLKIPAGQRIGIIGRTGSGKSSILAALIRMAQHSSGRMLVGGKNIESIPLRQLRLALHVLPQDPVIFEQSLRQNLDPWSRFTDAALCEALKVTGLLKTLQQETMAKKFDLGADRYAKQVLDMQVKGNGENFSKGQIQLICLARAILLKPKILILDEATASIDPSADKMIQKALKTCFDAGTTIICIAHRLSSVAWMDRIVVMDAGRIVSDGTPSEILD